MRDLFTWSFPLGRVFGIAVRVHVLFPVVAAGLVLRLVFQKGTPPGIWVDASMVVGLLFVSVLLHEFGHCFGARLVEGDAREVLLWPLGGLAAVDVPQTPRANFIVTAAGPLVNLALVLLTGLILTVFAVRPPLNPLWVPIRYVENGMVSPELSSWDGTDLGSDQNPWLVLLARLFWINWVLFLFNVLLPAFPLDGGRLFQCLLWPRFGFRQATLAAIYAGFVGALLLFIVAILSNELLFFALACFIYITCRIQWILLETGGEEALWGYDFSQGYTSLERDQPLPRRRRPNLWQRWRQRRAARKLQRQQEQREAEDRRMDELLEKVQRLGLQALTDEERRFLKRVSDKYRNRQ